MSSAASFIWGPFSRKGYQSIIESNARINIWQGSVRSGKTIASIARWLEYAEEGPPGDLLMAAKTERTLKRNILDPIFDMVGDNLVYRQGQGEATLYGRRIYVAGANDERSEGRIRGMTLAGVYGDELTLWPESFFKQCLARMSVEDAKLFGTTNPDSPYHWLKTEYLDRVHELNLKTWHFALEDNPNLPIQYIRDLKNEYTGLWYKRFIEGLWVVAEGAVYDMWDESRFCFNPEETPKFFSEYVIGVDYGTANPTSFLLLGRKDDVLYVLKEYHWDSHERGRQKTDSEYVSDLRDFIGDLTIRAICVDPSATSFKAECKKQQIWNVVDADNDVLDGIRDISNYLGKDQLKVAAGCLNLRKEFSSYMWDANAQLRGEDRPIPKHDHSLDALRYAIRTMYPNLPSYAPIDKPRGW